MKFPMISKYHGLSGDDYVFEYYDADSPEDLPKEKLDQVVVFAFHRDRLLIVNNTEKPGSYSPVGGEIEKDETPEEAAVREVKEESNMRVLGLKLIGYQKCINQTRGGEFVGYQIRYFARVEPYGPFEEDPDGDVTELIEINPVDYKKYFDWGKIGDRIMERAIEIKNKDF